RARPKSSITASSTICPVSSFFSPGPSRFSLGTHGSVQVLLIRDDNQGRGFRKIPVPRVLSCDLATPPSSSPARSATWSPPISDDRERLQTGLGRCYLVQRMCRLCVNGVTR